MIFCLLLQATQVDRCQEKSFNVRPKASPRRGTLVGHAPDVVVGRLDRIALIEAFDSPVVDAV